MGLSWLASGFICKELYSPFVVEKDCDYEKDLKDKYDLVMNQAQKANADDESLNIIRKYREKILQALKCYYKADIVKSYTIIRKLIQDVGKNSFAVSDLNHSFAFPGDISKELQFFRCRRGDPSNAYSAKDMLHLPKKMRSKSGNYRFSIPGNPSLYLSNSSYGCWIETGFPPENDFNVSPVVLDGAQKILNLAINIRDFGRLGNLMEERVHCWLKLYLLTLATSYRIKEPNRTFKSEYIISQAIMIACKKPGYDGVAYYSKRVTNEAFALCAINLVLFVDYNGEYSKIIKHMKMDDAFNYAVYKQLQPSLKYGDYDLRSVNTKYITNIGSFDRQYPYKETEFFLFDKFLFYTWEQKPGGKGKSAIPWGVSII